MSDKVYLLTRVLRFDTGEVMAQPMGVYADKAVAERECQARAQGTQALVQAGAVAMLGQGGKGEVMAPVSQFLASLGIVSVQYTMPEVTVRGALAVAEPPKIILGR